MSTASLQDLKHDPLSLVARVEKGESIILTRSGTPVAELRPVSAAPRSDPRPFGLASGEFSVPADFDEPLPEDVLRDFEGR